MRKFLRDLWTEVWNSSNMRDRRRTIKRDGLGKLLAFEWIFVRELWKARNQKDVERSEWPIRDIFMELRVGFDGYGTVSRWDLIEFARLSRCEDLMAAAHMSAEEYQHYIESHGGCYPLPGPRNSASPKAWLRLIER